MNRPDISKLNHNRNIYLKIGFVIAIGFSILAFRWEVEMPNNNDYAIEDAPADIVETVIRTVQKKKEEVPPPPIENKKTDEIIAVDEIITHSPDPKPIEILVDNDAPIDFDNTPVEVPKIAPPKPPKREVKAPPIEIHDFAEQMPRFPGCEDKDLSKDERSKCAEMAMFSFIRDQIKYPTMARENDIQGKVFVQFVVSETGKITDVEVLRDAGGGLGKEGVRVIGKMPDWIPGKQRGQNVKVRMRMPIKFSLENF